MNNQEQVFYSKRRRAVQNRARTQNDAMETGDTDTAILLQLPTSRCVSFLRVMPQCAMGEEGLALSQLHDWCKKALTWKENGRRQEKE